MQVRPLPSAVQGTDGRLWFDESRGLVRIDPHVAVNPTTPATVTIQSLAGDKKTYDTASSVKLPAHTDSVQINYSAVSLSDPEAIRFRYKLQEIDKGWH